SIIELDDDMFETLLTLSNFTKALESGSFVDMSDSMYSCNTNFEIRLTSCNQHLEEIGQYFLNLQKSKEKFETENGDDSDSVTRNDENITDEKPKPTRLQAICMKIIDKLLNFLTASSPQLRVLVLDVI
ncbi:22123_t:CDS:2, partial [Gigaspora rosea]